MMLLEPIWPGLEWVAVMAKKMTVLDKEISLLKVCDEALIMANLPQLKIVEHGRLADVFPDKNILHTVCSKLNWSQLKLLLSIEDDLKRSFYIELFKLEKWSSRQLQERIQSMLYERTAISKKPEKLAYG